MPKTKPSRGRRKQSRPQQPEKPETEDALWDVSSHSSVSSVGAKTQPDPVDTQIEPSSEEEPTIQHKKRILVSKKEIPDYQWTEKGTSKLADLIKEHPQLYDKRQKDWLNLAATSFHSSSVLGQRSRPGYGRR